MAGPDAPALPASPHEGMQWLAERGYVVTWMKVHEDYVVLAQTSHCMDPAAPGLTACGIGRDPDAAWAVLARTWKLEEQEERAR